jgi:hypothetical protein
MDGGGLRCSDFGGGDGRSVFVLSFSCSLFLVEMMVVLLLYPTRISLLCWFQFLFVLFCVVVVMVRQSYFRRGCFRSIPVPVRCFRSIPVSWWGFVSVAGVSVKALKV